MGKGAGKQEGLFRLNVTGISKPVAAVFVQLLRRKWVFRTFWHFLALFLESAETPLFVQINVLPFGP